MTTKAQHARGYRPLLRLLRTLRTDAGFTQRALGGRLGKPQSWVYNCEVGNRRVDIIEFCDWCRACGLDPIAGLRRRLNAR